MFNFPISNSSLKEYFDTFLEPHHYVLHRYLGSGSRETLLVMYNFSFSKGLITLILGLIWRLPSFPAHQPFAVLLPTDFVTVSSQPIVTSEGLISSTENSLTTSPTTQPPTTDTRSVSLTVSMGTDVADHTTNPSDVTITAEQRITPFTNDTRLSVTSSGASHTDPYHLPNSTTLNFSVAVSSPTQEIDNEEIKNESTTHVLNPGNVFTLMPEESSTLENPNNSINQTTTRGTAGEGNVYSVFHK